MATKTFDPADFEAFLDLLPASVEGRRVRHAVEVRHDSFRTPELVALARARGIAIVLAADAQYPQIADPTARFVYARLMGTAPDQPEGYSKAALDLWADRARALAAGAVPDGLQTVAPGGADGAARDVFLYVIAGHKAANPAAAQALIALLA
jgi:uncharacterized protein YecE (DUF72 family)